MLGDGHRMSCKLCGWNISGEITRLNQRLALINDKLNHVIMSEQKLDRK